MAKPCGKLCLNQRSTMEAKAISLAICFHHQATQNSCNDWGKHPLCPPVYIHTCIAATWNCRNDSPMVESIDHDVRENHGVEERVGISTWEEENHATEQAIEEEIGVTSHVKLECHQPLLGCAASNHWMSADKKLAQLQWEVDGDEWLDQEWDEESGWETIRKCVLSEHALHGICLDL